MKPGVTPVTVTALVLGFVFLYLPILLLVIFSFNESRLVTVWSGFSLKWYSALWGNSGLLDAAWTSLRIAALSATLALVLGTLAGLGLVPYALNRNESLSPAFAAGCFSPP